MEKLQTSHDVAIQWHSYELRPRGAAPISPEYRAAIESKRPELYERARTEYGLEMNPGPFGINSRPALVGVKYAESKGIGNAFHQAVLKAYWLEAQAIDDLDVLTAIAVSTGLDADGFRAALTDATFVEAVDEDIAQAAAYGLQGVPALIFAEKYLVPGAVPYATLVQVVEEVRQKG
ncbi:MAG: DsbA family protein [Caldilineaceae bacterium]|nr:DsbA family protein [Caldilineaceae bacterium]